MNKSYAKSISIVKKMDTPICLKLKDSDNIGIGIPNVINFIKLLRQCTRPQLNLKEAKAVADGIKDGREMELLIAANLLADFELELKQYPVLISNREKVVEVTPKPPEDAICTLHLNTFRRINKKISLVKILKEYSFANIGLKEAKDLADKLCDELAIEYATKEGEKAALIGELYKVGVEAKAKEAQEEIVTIVLSSFNGNYDQDMKLRALLGDYTKLSSINRMLVLDELGQNKPFSFRVKRWYLDRVKEGLSESQVTFTTSDDPVLEPADNSNADADMEFSSFSKNIDDLGPLNPNDVLLRLRVYGTVSSKFDLVKALRLYNKDGIGIKEAKEMAEDMADNSREINFRVKDGELSAFIEQLKKSGQFEFAVRIE